MTRCSGRIVSTEGRHLTRYCFLRLQMAFLKADALEASGQRDAAVVELEALRKTFPTPRIQQRIDELKKGSEGRE